MSVSEIELIESSAIERVTIQPKRLASHFGRD